MTAAAVAMKRIDTALPASTAGQWVSPGNRTNAPRRRAKAGQYQLSAGISAHHPTPEVPRTAGTISWY